MSEPWGRCGNSATGFCPAAGKGALVCAATVCPGLEETTAKCKILCGKAYTPECQQCFKKERP